MASVTGMTAEAIDALMDSMVVSVRVDTNGQLIYKNRAGVETIGGPIVSPIAAVEKSWPVGSVFIHTLPTNPADLLGVGTWIRYGKGRVLVSQDEEQTEFSGVDNTGGSKAVTLQVTNLPSHNHSIPAHSHSFTLSATVMPALAGGTGSSDVVRKLHANNSGSGDATGSTSSVSATSGSTGSATPFSNLPPYIVVYMWKRTN